MGSTQPNGIARSTTSAIGRMTMLLDAFGDDSELSQVDFVERTGLPKATVHRTVGLLVEFGWLQRLGDRYRLGLRLFELGGRVPTLARLREVSIPFMQDLYEVCHEIVNLGVLDGTSLMYLEKVGSHRRIETPARVGSRVPGHCTALGKAIMAFGPPAVVEASIATGLEPMTARSVTTPAAFRAAIAKIAEEGFSVDDEEFAAGMICCAAPIRGSGHAIAAISVTGPVERMDVAALRPHVTRAAAGIANAYLGRPTQGRRRLQATSPTH